jgi:carbon monoxide dehydrogenase subunit G
MEILGQQIITAPRQRVWDALNDPDTLKACLPGCELVERISPEEFRVIIKTAIGPLKARFQGSLKITEAQAPASCVMQFEGQGGAVGFGKGTSSVVLKEVADSTELSYEAKAQIGGKLAQVGSRLIDSVAKKMADDFFKAFQNELTSIDKDIKEASTNVAVTPIEVQDSLSNSIFNSESRNPIQASNVHTVPAWWLLPAAMLGAALTLAGARWIA